MISYLIGLVKNPNEKYFTLLTESGVGYKVFSNLPNLLSLTKDQKVEMLIYTVVKDEAIDLYGFKNEDELYMFEKLISVSGVGPKSALNLLSVVSVKSLAQAIAHNDLASLPPIPGIGKKSLEKIFLELKDKLALLTKNDLPKKNPEEADARLALSSLGYSEKDISQALGQVKKEKNNSFEKLKLNELLKETLKYLR